VRRQTPVSKDRNGIATVKGESMGVTAFPHPVTNPDYPYGQAESMTQPQESPDWLGITVGGTFLVGSLLLLSGKKRAGLVVTAAATALTLLDQQETIREWWNTLPQYLDEAQRLLDQAQSTVDDLAAKREKLRAMFDRR
jgi:hypothetical protein